jgi:hypothetical protein
MANVYIESRPKARDEHAPIETTSSKPKRISRFTKRNTQDEALLCLFAHNPSPRPPDDRPQNKGDRFVSHACRVEPPGEFRNR